MNVVVQNISTNEDGKPTFEAFGELRTLEEWLKDSRCKVARNLLYKRVLGGWTLEEAMSVKAGECGTQGQDEPIRAFGEVKTLEQWGYDHRSRAPIVIIRQRIRDGFAAEQAITLPGLIESTEDMLPNAA